MRGMSFNLIPAAWKSTWHIAGIHSNNYWMKELGRVGKLKRQFGYSRQMGIILMEVTYTMILPETNSHSPRLPHF